jgi:hypothetical protein
VTIVDELGLREADLAALARDEPERALREGRRAAPPGETDREVPPAGRSRETAGGQVRCPACGFEQTPTSSSCRRCGNRLREPRRETRVAAVLGEERDVLAELGLDEDDLRESLGAVPRSDLPRGGGEGRRLDHNARTRVRQLAEWAESLVEGGRSPDEAREIIRPSGHAEAEVDEALRLAEARVADPADRRDGADLDLPSLEEADGLDGWLAARVGGPA